MVATAVLLGGSGSNVMRVIIAYMLNIRTNVEDYGKLTSIFLAI